MVADAFFTAALALTAGMAAQAVSSRFVAIPSIVFLISTGVLLGPDGLAVLDPSVFGEARSALVSLAVTVILFEGGLALDLVRLRQLQRSLLLLLTLGAAISMGVGTLAAHAFLDISWSIATLYGALMIVTGPTVVTPLLSRLTVNRRVRELLVSEGVLIDPVGAIIAIVAAEYVVGHAAVLASGWQVFVRLVGGTLIGAMAGFGLAVVLRRRWVADDIVNPFVLAVVLLVAAWASEVSAEAGLMAAVVQGAVLANAGLRGLRRLREFKEALTVLLLSFIFIILAADLRLEEVRALGWSALAVVAAVVWVARPLGVFSCTVGSELTIRERLFASWICPRGIVAVAVAGLFRTLLDGAGIPGGNHLEALVFVTVATTVGVQGLTAEPMARLLEVNVLSLRGTIVIGAERFARLLARLLSGMNRQVAIIDRSPRLCRIARKEGFSVYEGDALSFDILEDAGVRYADTAVALTRNPDLNALVARRIRDDFQVERVLAITDDPEQGTSTTATQVFAGNFPGIDETNRLLRLGRLSIVNYDTAGSRTIGTALADLPYADGEFAMLVGRGNSAVVATPKEKLAKGDMLLCLRPIEGGSPLAGLLNETGTLPARTTDEE